MIKKHIDWRKFKYQKNGSVTGEIKLFENNRTVDRFIFNDREGYKEILKVMKRKYGFVPESEKFNQDAVDEAKEELKLLSEHREKEEKKEEIKQKGFLDKDWEW